MVRPMMLPNSSNVEWSFGDCCVKQDFNFHVETFPSLSPTAIHSFRVGLKAMFLAANPSLEVAKNSSTGDDCDTVKS
jgi:hypothetical protein